jgi:redox-sensing transcriptional repressor
MINIYPVESAPEYIKENDIKVAIITVPAEAAQDIVDLLAEHGIRAVLNFAPVKLKVPKEVHVHNADLTIELQSLIYYSSAEEERLKKLQQEVKDEKTAKSLQIE